MLYNFILLYEKEQHPSVQNGGVVDKKKDEAKNYFFCTLARMQ
jgi:hypothetical protein